MPKVTEPRMGRARIRRRWELPIIIYDLVTVCLPVRKLRQWVVCVCVLETTEKAVYYSGMIQVGILPSYFLDGRFC